MMRILLVLGFLACSSNDDFDGDGFVEPADCDDNDALTFPGAEEIAYDRKDQDCDGFDLTDVDGDGFDAEQVGGDDCNDLRPRVNPDAVEIPYDGIDQNCDGWNDNDFDQDGYEAQSEGGADCNDFDASVVPLDLDGDGFTPCTGDCDEQDPYRNPSSEPICGNGLEDDCDGVSDCALTGAGILSIAPFRIEGISTGDEVAFDLGRHFATPGDATGDGAPDVVAASFVDAAGTAGRVWWFAGPFGAVTTLDDAVGSLTVPGGDVRVVSAGDIDGDSLGDVMVSFDVDGAMASVGLFGAPPNGASIGFDAAYLEVRHTAGGLDQRMGDALAALDDGAVLAIGAKLDGCTLQAGNSCGSVNLIPTAGVSGVIAYGSQGARLEGTPQARAGQALHAFDYDGDGVDDLLVGEDGFDILSPAYARLVPNPPTGGVHLLSDLAVASVDLTTWGDGLGGAASGDLDGDGSMDLVIGAPRFASRTGGVAVFTGELSGVLDPNEAEIARFAIGQDSMGTSLAVHDFDGDGFDDLVVGAPATLGAGGDGEPGSLLVWYGPLQPGVELSLQADLQLEGVGTVRTEAGADVGFTDLDQDGWSDLLVSSPGEGGGLIYAFPGGATALNGI